MSQATFQHDRALHKIEINQDPASIQEALEEILRSLPFRTTRQCQNLLRYVVDHTLMGQDSSLRERVIGAEVFGRSPDYDTGEDPVVRIRAAEVRKRLAQYYQSCHENELAVRIDLPPGSYRAAFEWISGADSRSKMTQPPVRPQHHEERVSQDDLISTQSAQIFEASKSSSASPKTILSYPQSHMTILVMILLLCGGLTIHFLQQSPNQNFKGFWAPILSGPKPVLICMGSNVVYELSHEYMMSYLHERNLDDRSLNTFIDLPPDTSLRAGDLQLARDSFVSLGDVAAVSSVVTTLTKQGKSYQQRFPPDISFAELQSTPVVLIGGFNNPLTIALTKNLRFTLTRNSRIEDRENPAKFWAVPFHGDARETEDYAVVSRLLDSNSGGPIISIAGIGQYGTQAAATFISDPKMIAAFAHSAPPGWINKNLQIVLHVRVIDFRPVSVSVVGSSFW